MGGHHFGELAKVRGIVVHKISPFEQRAFAGVVSKGIPNTLRRMRGSLFRVVPRKFLISSFVQRLLIKLSFSLHHRLLGVRWH